LGEQVIGGLIDDILGSLGDMREGVSEALFQPTLRLGVTGLSRAGKTVFITSLVANLLERGRLLQLSAQSSGRIEAVVLRPHPDRGVPRFDFETHRNALSALEPHWPNSTRAVAQLRLSIRYKPKGLLSGFGGASLLHLDVIDYPGEWLLDLPLLEMDYREWSERSLEKANTALRKPAAGAWLALLGSIDADAKYDEANAAAMAGAYTEYLARCRARRSVGADAGALPDAR
jgi:predicted YcjX-like family ATPase